jgi:phenylacetate-coenzyme A ligase PaaK-like adenylate-forming protein
MRCWDGGASFFTCKNGTYHLNDNFAWTIEGPDNKMISTDYFNLASPFINYYNGDLCKIENEYHKCSCGRYYRPFKMLQNRPFALKGTSKLIDIKQQISQLSFKKYLIQVQFENLSVRISSSRELSSVEKEILQDILKEYEIFWK